MNETNTQERIELTATAVEIQAAASQKKPPRFTAVAYTGAIMSVDGFRLPLILDLSGMKADRPNLPTLRDHDDSRVVGHITNISIDASGVVVEGIISGAGADAAEVAQAARNGFTWQVSLGSTVVGALESLAAGEMKTVNGREVTGPLQIARRSEISEVSFVARGADGNTSAAIAAKGKTMKNEVQESAVTEQFERVQKIEATCSSIGSSVNETMLENIRVKAIAGDLNDDEFHRELLGAVSRTVELQALRDSRPIGISSIDGSGHGVNDPDSIIQAALLTRAGYADVAENDFGERVMEQSKQLHGSSLVDIIRAGYQMAGMAAPRDRDDLIRTAFSKEGQISASGSSMYSLPNTLSNTMGLRQEAWRRRKIDMM